MENEAYVCYAMLAYRRMRDLGYDENTFESVLKGIIREYNTVEVIKEVRIREEK